MYSASSTENDMGLKKREEEVMTRRWWQPGALKAVFALGFHCCFVPTLRTVRADDNRVLLRPTLTFTCECWGFFFSPSTRRCIFYFGPIGDTHFHPRGQRSSFFWFLQLCSEKTGDESFGFIEFGSTTKFWIRFSLICWCDIPLKHSEKIWKLNF